MSLSHLSAVDSSNSHRSSSSVVAENDHHKRKFDEYASSSSPDFDFDRLHKMNEHEFDADHIATPQQSLMPWSSGKNYHRDWFLPFASEKRKISEPSNQLQIFVRMMSGGKTIVIQAEQNDTVGELRQRIKLKTNIPATEQRLIYQGKQLQCEKSLSYYSIEKDSSIQLVARMHSTEHPVAWQIVNELLYLISRMYKCEILNPTIFDINEKLDAFFSRIPLEKDESIEKYLRIFSNSSVPAALVMLSTSSLVINKCCAKSSIKLFFDSCKKLNKNQQNYCIPIVLEFCSLIRKASNDHMLYDSGRITLGKLLESTEDFGELHSRFWALSEEILTYFNESVDLLVNGLLQNSGPSDCDVNMVSTFWNPLRMAIEHEAFFSNKIPVEVEMRKISQSFEILLSTMSICMCRIEALLGTKGIANTEALPESYSHYLTVLKIIDSMTTLYHGAMADVTSLLDSRKVAFCALVLKFANRDDDHEWIHEYKDVTIFECRRHLAMLLFPDVKEHLMGMHEMLIDRSNLLAESFEYIKGARPEALHGLLFMEFKNEEATGPGVLREWFYSLCQEIFKPQNALFLRADDLRRFSPNSASNVDPLHPEFFKFAGRVIALALMHKVQVGVLFDRVFFLQLAGKRIYLEDIKDTDRIMYNSCKQILEMDPEFFDSNDGLGLTFMSETEELGQRITEELCPGGKLMAVNSKNRERYINLLIKHRFVRSISNQVSQFSRGFKDILSDFVSTSSFFEKLNLEDLDGMLHGGENSINIEDWKAHTEYNGFKETDDQIHWFWKILKKMTEEEQRNILFFWTSNKFIPVEGFRGLSSKLNIYRIYEANDHLPMSQTCFYRLCLPKYTTMPLMEQRLRFIAQDHISSSFGKS